MAKGKAKRQEISVTEADLRLLREHLGEDVDLIEGAHVHARGDVRISLSGDELRICSIALPRLPDSPRTARRSHGWKCSRQNSKPIGRAVSASRVRSDGSNHFARVSGAGGKRESP